MFLHNNPGLSVREGASRKEGQRGGVSEAVAEALWTFRKESLDVSGNSQGLNLS